METKTVNIPNLSCGHCVHTIENEVQELEGIEKIQIDLPSKKGTFQWEEPPQTWNRIKTLLEEIGFPPEEI